ncbi:hypothetical protein FOA52_008119 [Chlamydomonas sp. UWO 241]|nr:hypothetical protein FOA52_008119 [Chlamydomonas sp. UWO 241]
MSLLLKRLNPEISAYKDRRFEGDEDDWERALKNSTHLYVGNLSFFTREEQIYEVFSKVGHVQRVVMGLDKFNKTPCGFCFVMYYLRHDSDGACKFLNGTMLDDRTIRVDHDWGFVEGRQWGRGRSGGQVRDEFRVDYDPGRGGFGKVVQKEIMAQQDEGLDGEGYEGGGGGGGDVFSPAPAQEFKRRRIVEDAREPEEENPRFRGRKSDDEGDG